MKKRLTLLSVLLFLLLLTLPAGAQEAPRLTLSLFKDFGFNLGSSIQGTFSYRVSGPDDLARVVFLMDGESIGEDNEAPFRLQFKTDNFALGVHAMSAVGYTVDGRTLQSNTIQRQFVSGSESNRFLYWVILPIILLALAGRLITSRMANRDSKQAGLPAISGPFGGTLCPKCGRPFAMHIWGLNLLAGKYDRCPHCGKWSLVRRVHPDILRGAAEAFAEGTDPEPAPSGDDPHSLAKRLDESRFDDL